MKNFKFNGKLYGINITYYENGKILRKCYYKNDTIQGEYFLYYENGKIWFKLNKKKIEIKSVK
jgi:antitoxin component YwqK of YwqJK toxin-antitoxin module